jgi:hypothetical protein
MNLTQFVRNAAVASLLLTALPCDAADETFSFYGLQFGMSRAAVAQQTPLLGNQPKNPGHGMTDLELVFDREDQLVEIRASWARPDDPLAYQGALRALREKFVTPVGARYPSVAVTLDEYSNRAAIRLVFLATNLRERNIEYHKSQFLKALQ